MSGYRGAQPPTEGNPAFDWVVVNSGKRSADAFFACSLDSTLFFRCTRTPKMVLRGLSYSNHTTDLMRHNACLKTRIIWKLPKRATGVDI